MSRIRRASVEDPLCCCEFEDLNGRRSHVLACCCDCEALDIVCDRYLTCRGGATDSQMSQMLATLEDRCRVPGLCLARGHGGAVRVPLDICLPPFLLPSLVLLATLGPGCTVAGGVGAVLSLVACAWCLRRGGGTPGSCRSRLFYSWSLTSCAVAYGTYVSVVVGFREVLLWETMLLTTLGGATMLALYHTKRDPGIIDKGDKLTRVQNGASSSGQFGVQPALSYCSECKLDRPARSGHCPLCGVCIRVRDHHCIWIDSCIGAYNHRSFLSALVLAIVTGCYGTNLTLTTVCTPEMYLDWFLLPSDCRFVYADFPTALSYVVACYTALCVTALCFLLLHQCWLISHNVTSQELHRSSSAPSSGWRGRSLRLLCIMGNNRYGRGLAQNWRDFMRRRRHLSSPVTLGVEPTTMI